MAFQIPDFTQRIDWLAVDTCNGVQYIPLCEIGRTRKELEALILESDSSPDEVLHTIALQYRDYLDIVHPENVWEVSLITAYGARLSAPGYMDCTDWTLHSSPTAAIKYIRDFYLDEEYDRDDPDLAVCFKRETQLDMIRWMKG